MEKENKLKPYVEQLEFTRMAKRSHNKKCLLSNSPIMSRGLAIMQVNHSINN